MDTKIEDMEKAYKKKEVELGSAKGVIETCKGSAMFASIVDLTESKDQLSMKVAEKITAATECQKEKIEHKLIQTKCQLALKKEKLMCVETLAKQKAWCNKDHSKHRE